MMKRHNLGEGTRILLFLGLMSAVGSVAPGQDYLHAWSGTSDIRFPPVGADYTQVSSGQDHSLALRTDGSIVAWGLDNFGMISNAPAGTGFVQVAAGYNHAAALRSDGSIVSWGEDLDGQVTNTPAGTGFIQVAVGLHHSVALHTDGTLVSWGGNQVGQVSLTPTGSNFVEVSAGIGHSLARRANGRIKTWGQNNYEQVTGTPKEMGFVQISGGGDHSLALRADGSIVAWGRNTHGQVSQTPTGTGFTQVSGGFLHSMALHPDGTIESWGYDGILNLVTWTHAGPGFTAIAGGVYHSAALRETFDGSAYCFGDGSGSTCPCGLPGNVGEGCANSTGVAGAQLRSAGVSSMSSTIWSHYGLVIRNAPPMKAGLILRGANQVNGGLGNLVGDGLLCTSGQSARSSVELTTASGDAYFHNFQGNQLLKDATYGIGATTHYQFWYRDPDNTCSGSGFNFSNAWAEIWWP